jgi:malate dehydrogenase (oxaloacetate-decarboxylating)(NADP+)
MTNNTKQNTEKEALLFHKKNPPGKVAILATKPLLTQQDLALAYSPGVAYPCIEIEKNPSSAYDYTAKGNFVAVISNGTAVLGLGNLGALASKPVMEGKAVLFKRFADIDAVDIEVSTEDPEEFINCVKLLGASWGGINLEDIKAPDCFIIEEKLKSLMDIPVFHDDQHGTAIITLAGIINALHLTERKMEDIKIVATGAGAASIACIDLLKKMGVQHNNVILTDSKGVIYKGRKEGMNPWKEKHAIETTKRTLEEAMKGADVVIGLSVKGLITPQMVKSMNDNPIIFALANPEPEITPEEVKQVRQDAIIATGRSDYPNQVNNVMGFPYIFRGALDVRAKHINDEMKIAAALSIAELARKPVPDEVSSAYSGRKLVFGPDYIIPVPFDSRLMHIVPIAVAKSAMDSKIAQKPISDFKQYKHSLISRLNPSANLLQLVFEKITRKPKRIIFADGEEIAVIKAAINIHNGGFGKPILVGRVEKIKKVAIEYKITEQIQDIEIANAKISPHVKKYIEYLYKENQRNGLIYRDCVRLVKNDRNIFSACMLQCNDGDALVAGQTRNYASTIKDVFKVIKGKTNADVFGLSILITPETTLFIADSSVNIEPTAEQFVNIAVATAQKAKELGQIPRVAFLAFSSFNNAKANERTDAIQQAIKILDQRKDIDFEYEGEMTVHVALDPECRKFYPFNRLSGPANILIMPSLNAAHISSKLLEHIGKGTLIGPITQGFKKPVQIVHFDATVEELTNMAAFALSEAI